MAKTGIGPKNYELSYATAIAAARLAVELLESPTGVSFERIQDRFGVSERTLFRYVKVLREDVFFEPGRPRIQVTKVAGTRLIRFVQPKSAKPASSPREILSLYFAMAALRGLEGTVLREDLAALWKRLCDGLTSEQRRRLKDIPNKFFTVPYAVKEYRKHDQLLAQIMRALIDQHRLRIDYGGKHGEGKVHLFDIYTLASYRGGLYLLGYSHLRKKIIWLALERIRSVSRVVNEQQEPLRFAYPRRYSPRRHTEGMFGIVDKGEPQMKVELLIRNAETEALLRPRSIHPTQKFRRRRDGKLILNMEVRGNEELANWIMSLEPWVEVLAPAELRQEVMCRILASSRVYYGAKEH